MPQIKEYQSQTQVQGPTQIRQATAEDFGAGVDRELRGLGEAITDSSVRIKRAQDQSEISDLNAKMSGIHAQFTIGLQERLRTADPNDKTVAEKFVTEFDEAVGKVGDNVSTSGGRAYFTQASAAMRAHFQENAAAGQADLAGVKAKTDYSTALNNYSSTLVNDPSSFQLMSTMHNASIDGLVSSGGLPSKAALQLKQQGQAELAKSAVRGWIKLDPQLAKKQLDAKQWDNFFDGDAKYQMYGEVKQAESAMRIEEERRRTEAKRLREEQQTNTQNQMLSAMTENKLSTKEILESNLDPFGSGSKQQFLNMLEAHENSKANKIKTDSGVFISLFEKIHLPDGNTNKIVDENDLNRYLGKGLTIESLNQLRAEMQGKKTQAGSTESELKKGVIDIAKGQLTRSNPLTGIRDPIGDEQQQRFMSWFLTEYEEKRKAGKSATELLDPNSSDYLGKQIGRFTRSQQQILQDMTRSLAPKPSVQPEVAAPVSAGPGTSPTAAPVSAEPTVNARQPGESAADYLKRTKGQ